MEGLLPYVYKAIVQYRTGGEAWFNDSPSSSYIRLPGDSGRFRAPEMKQHFSSSPSRSPSSSVTTAMSPLFRSVSRRRA